MDILYQKMTSNLYNIYFVRYYMDKKTVKNPNLVQPIVRKLYEIIPYLPSFINTYNLTLISIIWSSLTIYAGYKAQKNVNWLYLVIACIYLHLTTDNLDGAVGKYRNTGAVKWGYFMDHSMDFIFINSIFISLYLCLPNNRLMLLLLLIAINQSLTTSFLSLDKKGHDISFCISNICVGPADGLILFSLGIYYIIRSEGKVSNNYLVIFCVILFLINLIKMYQKQDKLHERDMKILNKKQK